MYFFISRAYKTLILMSSIPFENTEKGIYNSTKRTKLDYVRVRSKDSKFDNLTTRIKNLLKTNSQKTSFPALIPLPTQFSRVANRVANSPCFENKQGPN